MAGIRNDWAGIITTLRRSAGVGSRELSRSLGHSPSWLTASLSNYRRGGVPNADTLASIAEACGFELRIVGHGRDIRVRGDGAITPPASHGTTDMLG